MLIRPALRSIVHACTTISHLCTTVAHVCTTISFPTSVPAIPLCTTISHLPSCPLPSTLSLNIAKHTTSQARKASSAKSRRYRTRQRSRALDRESQDRHREASLISLNARKQGNKVAQHIAQSRFGSRLFFCVLFLLFLRLRSLEARQVILPTPFLPRTREAKTESFRTQRRGRSCQSD